MSISVNGVTKLYGEQHALETVSFEIAKGEIVGFLGPNGAGKSTMMKIITCFIPQTNGQVSVCGFDVNADPMAVRKRIGYLPEHNPQYLEMYVKEYLHFVAGVYGLSNAGERIAEMIDRVGLTVEQNKKIGALSKGYRQRVGLAQALLHDPEVLILDEPTTGLDPNQIVEIRNLIREIGKEKTVMMSTHIMQEVEAICDRVIIINNGQIVADKSTRDLQGVAQNRQVITAELDQGVRAENLQEIPGVSQVITVSETRYELQAEPDQDIRAALFRFAVDHNRILLEMRVEEQNLEDVFQQLTRA